MNNSENEQSLLMAEKSDNDLIKYAEQHVSVDDGILISELLRRWKQARADIYHLEGKLALIDEKSKGKVVRL